MIYADQKLFYFLNYKILLFTDLISTFENFIFKYIIYL